MHKSNRSRWSVFLHDLITVDFGQADIYTGLRFATLLVPLLVLGLITRHVGEAFILMLGGGYVLAIDEIRSTGPRTLILLAASVLYASIFAIGMIISMGDYFVVPLLAFGLFIISYLRVFPRAFIILMFASTVYVIAIATQGTTLTIISQAFLLIVVGGLWATLSGVIFLARKSSKPALTDGFVQGQHQQQSQSKLTWQDKSKLLTSNLSIHSQYFQYAIALAITSAIGLLITQYFELHEGGWVLITIVVILMPAYTDISLTFNKVVHRIVGTIIGAVIAIIIINNLDNQWLLSLLLFLFASAYVSLVKTKNYAFVVIFMTVMILLLIDIPNPSTSSIAPFTRIHNVLIGCSLSLLVAFIIWIPHRKRSNLVSGHERE